VSVYKQLHQIIGEDVVHYETDVRDTSKLVEIIDKNSVQAVIHFAALKAVGESTEKPLEYYENNISGLLSVLNAMNQTGLRKLIFSSSCTVYGDPDVVPIDENTPQKPTTNPYGETKQMAERIITDVATASSLQAVLLRYFNPIGAHESALIGELPLGVPNNLVPYITQTAAGIRDKLVVFGDDYDTPDGSGIRDYIHVVDLAKAHIKALEYLDKQEAPTSTFNIGTGSGASVLELIKTFEKVNKVKVPYKIGPRRAGDIARVYALPTKAEKKLGWKAEKSLEDALKDAWRWQKKPSSKHAYNP